MPPRDKRTKDLRDMQPITQVTPSEVVGLLKAVEQAGGEADAAEIAQGFEVELDRMGSVVGAAEFLGLANASEGDVRVTEIGRKVLAAGTRSRKAILRDIIRELPAFRQVIDTIRAAQRPLERKEVLASFAQQAGTHNAQNMFDTLVHWGRYVELLSYDSESEQLSIRSGAR